MPTVTPNQRKWLAHLADGHQIYITHLGPRAGVPRNGERLTPALVNRMRVHGYADVRDARLVLTECGRLALVVAEVTPPMHKALKKAVAGGGIPWSKQNTVGALYELALIDDRGLVTVRGRRVLEFIEKPATA